LVNTNHQVPGMVSGKRLRAAAGAATGIKHKGRAIRERRQFNQLPVNVNRRTMKWLPPHMINMTLHRNFQVFMNGILPIVNETGFSYISFCWNTFQWFRNAQSCVSQAIINTSLDSDS